MGKYANKVVGQAQAWVGKNEKDGSFKAIIDTYNSHKPLARGYKVKYTDEWCATFVSAVSIKLGYTDIIPTECGCPQMIEHFKRLGCWAENEGITPKAGYIILYDWQDNGVGDNKGRADHIGIVEKVSGNTITVIEGNYKQAVSRRTIKVNAKCIRGYGMPKYDTEPVVAKKSVEEIAKEVLNGKWGNGEDRKKRLTAAGYNYTEVQNAVNALSKKPTKPAVNYYPKYTGTSVSIVTALNSLKINSSFGHRKKIAKANSITLYIGSASQNSKMVKLLKQGKLIKP